MDAAKVLQIAVEKLEAGTIKKRAEGLDDLQRSLQSLHQSSKLQRLDEHGWEKIFTVLFGALKSDKQDLLTGAPTARTRALNRLDNDVSGLKLIVTTAAGYIGPKTAYSVLEKISNQLKYEAGNEEIYLRYAQTQLLKCFQIILSRQSCCEHLSTSQWLLLVDFTIKAINANSDSLVDDNEVDAADPARLSGTNGSMRDTMPVRSSQSSGNRGSAVQASQVMDDLIVSLRSLSCASNSPLHLRLEKVAQTIMSTLVTALQAKDVALESLNAVLAVARTENTALLTQIGAQILVLIRKLWTHKIDDKSFRMREQILISILLVRPILDADQYRDIQIDAAIADTAAKHMIDEYESRSSQHCLHVSNLHLKDDDSDEFFCRYGIGPDLSSTTTANWTALSIITLLRSYAHRDHAYSNSHNEIERATKRRRFTTTFPDRVRLLFLDEAFIEVEDVMIFLQDASQNLRNDPNESVSWVLFVASRLCRLKIAHNAKVIHYWPDMWRAASQLAPNASTTRAACFCMNSLLLSRLMDSTLNSKLLTDSCFHGGSRGPPVLVDSALILMTTCLNSQHLTTERNFMDFGSQVLSWFDKVWSLPAGHDHASLLELAQTTSSTRLYLLITAMLGKTTDMVAEEHLQSSSAIYLQYLQMQPTIELLNFRLGSKIITKSTSKVQDAPIRLTARFDRAINTFSLVTDFLFQKLEDFKKRFRDIEYSGCDDIAPRLLESKRKANLSIGLSLFLCNAVTAISLAVPENAFQVNESIFHETWGHIIGYVKLQLGDNVVFEDTFEQITSSMLAVRAGKDSQMCKALGRRVKYAKALLESISPQKGTQPDSADTDLELASQPASSQRSQSRSQIPSYDVSTRRDVLPPRDVHGSFVEARIRLLQDSLNSDPSQAQALSTSMTEMLLTLPASDMLASRNVFIEWLQRADYIGSTDLARMLVHFGDILLGAGEYERNEAALCFCLKMLRASIFFWPNTDDESLDDAVFSIYSWFIEIAMKETGLSPQVLYQLTALLGELTRVKPRYGADDIQSSRTSMLMILKGGTAGLRFSMVSSLRHLFEGYTLTEHAAIFDDLVDCLPTDPEDVEGIAVRLFIIADIGSRFGTLLRQAVWLIFETAANVSAAAGVAHAAVNIIASRIGWAQQPKRVFKIFASQIFFIWFQTGALDTIPYSTFGFDSLQDLVLAEQQELVPQLVLNFNVRRQKIVTDILQATWRDLLLRNFPKSVAYAIVTDIAEDQGGGAIGSLETMLREQIGEAEYIAHLKAYFPEVVIQVVLSLEADRGIEKAWKSIKAYRPLAEAYAALCAVSSSSIVYPFRQQPSFRPKYLMPVLSRLVQVTEVNESFVTPALLARLYRKLLDDAECPSGPLHAASVIRIIRLAVVLGKQTSFTGYPLEMLVHNLRPYLVKFYCAPDVIGIYRYLFEHGHPHLQKKLPFLAGLSVTIFASLATFAKQPQESSTQGSHFQNTLSGAQTFRKWLETYLRSFDLASLGEGRAERFRNIVSNAATMSATGSNGAHDPEGLLLYHLIMDQATLNPLISKQYFVFLLRIMSKDFQLHNVGPRIFSQPEDREDLLRCALVLQAFYADIAQGHAQFRSWIGLMLGRACSSFGPTMISEQRESSSTAVEYNLVTTHTSQQLIYEALTNMTYSDQHETASVAEQTVSLILSTISRTERKSILQETPHRPDLQDLVFEKAEQSKLWLDDKPEIELLLEKDLDDAMSGTNWAKILVAKLIDLDTNHPFLGSLREAITRCDDFASTTLSYLVHLILQRDHEHNTSEARDLLTASFRAIFAPGSKASPHNTRLVIEVLTYLRHAPIHREATMAVRNSWIELDFLQAARAASKHDFPETALLLYEIAISEQDLADNRSRRSSILHAKGDSGLESDLFRKVADRDYFYASLKDNDVSTVVHRLRHEHKGVQVLAYESALFGARMKLDGIENAMVNGTNSMISALALANMNSLAQVVQDHPLSHSINDNVGAPSTQSVHIHEWDISDTGSLQSGSSISPILLKIEHAENMETLLRLLDNALCDAIPSNTRQKSAVSSNLDALTVLADIHSIISAASEHDLEAVWTLLNRTPIWHKSESFEFVSTLVAARESTATSMRKNRKAVELFSSSAKELLVHEIQAVRASLRAGEDQQSAQFRLNRAAYLDELRQMANREGLGADQVITFDVANTLWSQGEVAAPLEMLQSLTTSKTDGKQGLTISKSELFTELGQKLSEARQDHPDEVINRYLKPAISALNKDTTGFVAGRVYHNFAAYCDKQLQDSAEKDEFDRVTRVRNRKLQEVEQLTEMVREADKKTQKDLAQHYSRAKKWFKLDDDEYHRLKANRDELLRNALESYLLSLRACDDYKEDVLRLVSLWLGNAENDIASKQVRDTLKYLPSMKLAPFVQQLSSRLLDNGTYFQKGLQEMLFRIWWDHPYQTQYQLFASSKSKLVGNDPVAQSRLKAASALAEKVRSKGGKTSTIWVAIHNTGVVYVAFAQEQLSEKERQGSKLPFKKFTTGLRLQESANGKNKIPPPVMDVPLRADKNYDSVPVSVAFEPQVSIAGGISAPKIVTVLATDGSRHKMLFKGGNDDLRQDAIMEQVFEQVSGLLHDYPATRQRKLGIRTYKVIPLFHNAGIIEFVQNTIPLHDYLLPAHARYYPKDWKPTQCRKVIDDASKKQDLKGRLAVYREATNHFRPVMRFFFMENFLDPQEWFQKRLNYSRSTAAISMLGHILGVGDRHGHNILLDQRSGEAVHIDLGVAFEAGRILPIPEVVPFRLTRDIVDGMGVSGVEGPFRRCCLFTMEALRKSEFAIMTILDVLRWDPLYNWQISPVRMQRIQAQQERDAEVAAEEEESEGPNLMALSKPDEAAEAERALNVVRKKLTPNLSVEATVNELIREAVDENNLAVMYAGWAAYI